MGAMLNSGEFSLVVVEDQSEGDILTVRLIMPSGQLDVQAEAHLDQRTLTLARFNIEGIDIGVNDVGAGGLLRLAQLAMEVFDVDCLRIDPSRRTSGARRFRYTAPLTFRRKGSPGP